MFSKLIIFGASRGLGRSLALQCATNFEELCEIHLVSRKSVLLDEVTVALRGLGFKGAVGSTILDLTKEEAQAEACRLVKAGDYDLVIYCAGGGPHGEFRAKEWKDHRWAIELNLIAPSRILHGWLNSNSKKTRKFVVVGSRIAENKPDPLAASYSGAKSGLFGLLNSLQPELEGKLIQAWLFSPGYMDTEMLPSSATVRRDGSKIMSTDAAALAMIRWIKKDGPWHRVLN